MTTLTTQINTHSFEHRSVMHTTIERMMAFHADPKALAMLTPPPIFVQRHRDTRTSLTEGELEFTLWTETSFADCMIAGPMQSWRHEHIFRAVDGGVELLDRVTLAHKSGWRGLLSRLMFDGLPLRILFMYRHFRTRLEIG
jgi:ligand-binding SRPBCC domain-containing protein